MPKTRILHLEDDPVFAGLASATLSAQGLECEIIWARNRSEYQAALDAGAFDIILSDHALPDYDGLSAMHAAKRACPQTPFVFLSGTMGEETAVESMQKGASDYVLKSNLARLAPTVARCLDRARDLLALRRAQERIRRDQANLRGLIENTSDAIWSLDMEFRVMAFNSAASLWAMKLGGQPLHVDGDFLAELPEAVREPWRAAARRILRRESFREERRLEWQGRVDLYEVSFSPIISDGAVAGMAVSARDVTAFKRMRLPEGA